MENFTQDLRKRLYDLGTTNISDAMQALGFSGAALGIVPLWDGCRKAVGEAVTLKMVPTDHTRKASHVGVHTVECAKAGDIIVVDNGGRMDLNTCGGLMATACTVKGVAGWISDGVVRDVDEIMELDFPVYARGRIVETNRGKLMEYDTNIPVVCGGVLVRPGDIMVCDHSGVVCIPRERTEEVTAKAEEIAAREAYMIAQLKAGVPFGQVDRQVDYENMLKKGE